MHEKLLPQQVCVHAHAGDTVHGCPEGPVTVEHDIETCVTAEEFEHKLKEMQAEHEGFEHVVEELIPGWQEKELHDKMETGALFKAGVCADP